MKIPTDLMTFDVWWNQNKAVYITLGVQKEIAQAIWSACADSIESAMIKTFLINR